MRRWVALLLFLLLFSSCDTDQDRYSGNLSIENQIIDDSGQKIPPSVLHDDSSSSTKTFNLNKPVSKKSAKKKNKSSFQKLPDSPPIIHSDSLRQLKINYLRRLNADPDLLEPFNRSILVAPASSKPFESMIMLSRETILRINFDNDILDYTDRFYTNGIKIEFISPKLTFNPLNRLMIPYWNSGTNYYGLSLVQNMYTPSTTKQGGILYGDRPYAAYLYLGTFKITNDPFHQFRQTSELDLGIIGPNSYGEWVQRSFHNAVPTNNEPLGWEFQIKNDLVLNYNLTYEKGVIQARNLELIVNANGHLGTLNTNVAGGFFLRAGWFNPYFANLGIMKRTSLQAAGLRTVQLIFFLKGSGKLVAYDATLQGGLIDQSSAYTLPASEISRAVFQGSGGISLSVNGLRLDVEQFFLSPEFHAGLWHKWVHLAIGFSL